MGHEVAMSNITQDQLRRSLHKQEKRHDTPIFANTQTQLAWFSIAHREPLHLQPTRPK